MYCSQFIIEKGKSKNLSSSRAATPPLSDTPAARSAAGAEKYSLNNKDGKNPWFWTGFIDGEGSFNIFISKDQNRKLGWRVQVRFQIGLHKNDLALLQKLQQYLGGVGSIHPNKDLYLYFIDSKEGLRNLINHVEAYPL